jgi:hypothetical protein
MKASDGADDAGTFQFSFSTQGLAYQLFQRLVLGQTVRILPLDSDGLLILAPDKSTYMKIREAANSFFEYRR